jgi:uncharacterized protein YndB with AHSA1/START domain
VLPLFVIAAPITLIFLLSSPHEASKYFSTTTVKEVIIGPNVTLEMKGNCPNPVGHVDRLLQVVEPPAQIIFTEVDAQSSSPTVHRFAATEQCQDGSISPVSVLRWAYLMAHQESSSHNITKLLKASVGDFIWLCCVNCFLEKRAMEALSIQVSVLGISVTL